MTGAEVGIGGTVGGTCGTGMGTTACGAYPTFGMTGCVGMGMGIGSITGYDAGCGCEGNA